MKVYLGIDSGSVSTKLVLLNDHGDLVSHVYRKTQGQPIEEVQSGLKEIESQLPSKAKIAGVAVTGSARSLVGVITGADLIKNEITAQAAAVIRLIPDAQTVIEIGGQDSKIIILRDGLVADFGMNTVCAAGTGSFLDHQADRLNISIEEFSERALKSTQPVRIAGKCTVFAESDMIHKQQMGYHTDDIIYGLCQALARNFLSNVALGKEIRPPIVFQGGVALNQGIVKAFEEELKEKIIVPPNPELMGAIGAAVLVKEKMEDTGNQSQFKGLGISKDDYNIVSFECNYCSSHCEIAELYHDVNVLARWGGRCDRWEKKTPAQIQT